MVVISIRCLNDRMTGALINLDVNILSSTMCVRRIEYRLIKICRNSVVNKWSFVSKMWQIFPFKIRNLIANLLGSVFTRVTLISGIKISLKCKQAKQLTVTYTNKDGSFKTALPKEISASTASPNCVASVLGGPEQLYTKTKDMITNIIKVQDSYTISNPLSFYKSCPLSHGKCRATGGIEASKTFGLPPPGEWGFPPTAPYIPFFPIIGIP